MARNTGGRRGAQQLTKKEARTKLGKASTAGQKESSRDSASGQVDRDDLASEQFVQIVDLLCEGPIKGIVGGDRGIYLEDTPVEDEKGRRNFEGVKIVTRDGTQDQQRVEFLNGAQRVVVVGVDVPKATPVIRTITDSTVDAVRITIDVPQLQRVNDQGKFKGSSFELEIAVRYSGGLWQVAKERKIAGQTSDLYQRDFLVNLNGAFPVDIRVRRLTADSDNPREVNAFSWSAYTEITRERLRYPNSAIAALRFSAEQFSSIPSRKYLVDGLKIRLPNNASVNDNGRVTYSGIWNGTFSSTLQWCRDPAWILYDLLSHPRYGLGDHITDAQLDRFAFYSASQYCNELVPNNRGGNEQRFACNALIQDLQEAYTLINNLASVFRAMPYWATGSVTISQDRPQTPIHQFTLANVGPEGFSYSSTPISKRPTVAVVKYMDLDAMDVGFVEVQDQANLAKYGVTKAEVEAFACTSRSQAERVGEWLLYSEWYEGESITLTTSLAAGSVCRPGHVIQVSDPVKAGQRRGGRVVSATTTAITVDDASQLTGTGTLHVITATGAIESRAVVSISGNVITTAAFSVAPAPGTVWVHEISTVAPSLWRVVRVTEAERAQYQVEAVGYNPSKYGYIERSQALTQRDITVLNELPEEPINLSATSTLYSERGQVFTRIVLTWSPVPGISEYRVQWRQDADNWATAIVNRTDFGIDQSSPGAYAFQVRSVRGLVESAAAELSYIEGGKSAPPVDVSGLTLAPINEASATLRWDPASDPDVRIGGRLLIRHQAVSSGATWGNGIELVPPVGGDQTEKVIPLLTGTVMAKWEDSSGNRSANAASVVVTLPTPQPRLAVATVNEDAANFTGNKTNMAYDAGVDALVLAGGGLFDNLVGNVDSFVGNWDDLTGPTTVAPSGTYTFTNAFSSAVAGVFDWNVRRVITAVPAAVGSLFDDRQGLVDSWPGLWDGTAIDGTGATVYVRATSDDPAGTPTWGDWRVLTNNIVRGRGLQFKLEASSNDLSQNINVLTLGAEVELQDRTETSDLLTSGAATYNATFAQAFYQAPSVSITPTNMATGNYFTVTNVTRTGFSVAFRNSAAALVSRTFYYTAVGYGRQV